MDDDFFALKWNADLLTRDVRTMVCFEAETPETLLFHLRQCGDLDIVLLDVEYYPAHPKLPDLIRKIQDTNERPVIVCLSQYGEIDSLRAALKYGARGFLLKRDVRMGICSAMVLAMKVDFLITPGILPLLYEENPRFAPRTSMINPWKPHPKFTPRVRQVFTLRVLYGMSAPSAAREIFLAPKSIEKYMQYAYQYLSNQWGDTNYLAGVDLDEMAPEVQAFHQYSLPPKGDQI
jgi:DNA-binding NarL/FixJ family response regulator